MEKKRKEAIQQEVRQEVDRLLQVIIRDLEKTGTVDLEAVEIATRKAVHHIGAGILTELLRQEPPKDKTTECQCGGQAKYIGLRSKQILTAVGEASVLRAYYLCNSCHVGQAPVDKELDIEGTEFSPGVRRMMALVGSQSSFVSGRQQMEWLAGLKVTAKSVERIAESIGSDIAKREKQRIRENMQAKQTPMSKGEEIPILYVQADGSGIPVVRSEIDPDGIGKQGKPQRTKEAKIGCVFTQIKTDEQGRPARDESSTTYTAAIEGAAEFGCRSYKLPHPSKAVRRVRSNDSQIGDWRKKYHADKSPSPSRQEVRLMPKQEKQAAPLHVRCPICPLPYMFGLTNVADSSSHQMRQGNDDKEE